MAWVNNQGYAEFNQTEHGKGKPDQATIKLNNKLTSTCYCINYYFIDNFKYKPIQPYSRPAHLTILCNVLPEHWLRPM